MELDAGDSDALESDQSGSGGVVHLVATKMKRVKESIHKTAIKNIKKSQQRTNYDKKHYLMQVG